MDEQQKNLTYFMYFSIILVGLHLVFLSFDSIESYMKISYYEILNVLINGKFKFLKEPYINVLAVVIQTIYYIGTETTLDLTVKVEKIKLNTFIGFAGILLSSLVLFLLRHIPFGEIIYALVLIISYIIFIKGISQIRRLIYIENQDDIFNKEKETFPQTTQRIDTPFSVNIPYYFYYKKKWNRGWLNFINAFRSILVSGAPGSGKSFGTINLMIHQYIHKGFTMFVYDFKLPTLALEAFNALWHYSKVLEKEYGSIAKYEEVTKKKFPKYYQINFGDIAKSHRINPISSRLIPEKIDAQEAAKFIMEGLKGSKSAEGGGGSSDFFNLSAENLLTATIYYLKTNSEIYGKEFCTLPHVIELLIKPYPVLFSLLMGNHEVKDLASSFNAAFQAGVTDQLQGQVDSLVIPLGQLANPNIYWVFTGEDFNLNINNPKDPSILVIGNDPSRIKVYGIFLSLLNGKLTKIINIQNQLPLALILDEFPTLPFSGVTSLIATARSNKVATILGIQDQSQFVTNYGKDKATEIMNMVGSIITGQVRGELAEMISKSIGDINQENISTSIGKEVSITVSQQKAAAVTVSTLATLQQGEMAGTLADDFVNPIDLRNFHGKIDAMAPDANPTTTMPFKDIPIINKKFEQKPNETPEDCELRKKIAVNQCLNDVKDDIKLLQALEMARYFIVEKDNGNLLTQNYSEQVKHYSSIINGFSEENQLTEIGQEWHNKLHSISHYFKTYIQDLVVVNSLEGQASVDANDNIIRAKKQFITDFKKDERLKTLLPVYQKIKQIAIDIF